MGGKGNSSSDNSDTTAADGSSTFSTEISSLSSR
jgi:hypothetical protein